MRYSIIICCALLLGSSLFGVSRSLEAAPGDEVLVIVVHPEHEISNIDRVELRRVFLAETSTWPDGTRTLPINSTGGSPERTKFDELILEMNPGRVKSHWVDQRIRGAVRPPKEAASAVLR